MKKRLSIRDIAQQLDISITTVSFILNGKAKEKRISEQVTERVLKLVEELDYKPNQIARSLRTGKSKIICLMVENISNDFFSSIARHIEENAFEQGYKIIYCSTENKPEKTKELIKMFRERNIDGYIISPPEGIKEDIQALLDDNLPVVLFDRLIPGLLTHHVMIDNLEATYKATQHLVEQGYKNIAFITLNSGQTQMNDRLAGYQKAMGEHALETHLLQVDYAVTGEKHVSSIAAFLKANKQIDAVLFSTNYLATRGIEALNHVNLRIPTDIGVVAFDDLDFFKLYQPPITAVAQPVEEMSKKLIEIILKKLEGLPEDQDRSDVIVPTQLIIRSSSPVKEEKPS
ncbi:LacI family DNA-binding transcriptional regulator [Rufibacter sediminis]|uniref:LacI family DNA-binding transcriptional regulator n=1 Tax=Rufibacter sediminis TaxID=2762756 RepID=A0ABR6VSA2_9BACT|nr:LacI family DNA-binding transcriptional regulator [Rufibacter sediminis]MBC3540042.1 LacI family DNA-binding transcriptional regulator [Rufibacter sediminis]